MKKIVSILILILIVFLLTGCESSDKAKKEIFWQLKKDKIISKKIEYVEKIQRYYWTSEHCEYETYYIYKDENDKLLAINYTHNSTYQKEYDEFVTIITDLNVKEVEYFKEESCGSLQYKYDDGRVSHDNKYTYDLENESRYYAKNKKIKIFNKYTLKKANY